MSSSIFIINHKKKYIKAGGGRKPEQILESLHGVSMSANRTFHVK